MAQRNTDNTDNAVNSDNGEARYDVIIVGGRPAGAGLAARLGARGVRTLVLDRATFPSLPAVPSSAVLYPAGMLLLDEIGIDEGDYGEPRDRVRDVSFEFGDWFTFEMRIAENRGRDYIYGLDRGRFDDVLWRSLARYPSVTRREGWAVSDVQRDAGGRVIGVIGGEHGDAEERITARCVVGADSRFSTIARKVGAAVLEEQSKHVSTCYYADWEGVTPFREGVLGAHVFTTGRGTDVLFFPMPNGRTSVNAHVRADRVEVGGDAERWYLDLLAAHPKVARRLAGARRVGPVVGIKRIGNGYREPSGPGWVLVGDALHYKDPVDGQGIHDALLEGRILDGALGRWHAGELNWDEAMAEYRQKMWAATYPMYRATQDRLRRELYSEPPSFVIKTMLRWLMTDPEYHHRFMRFLGRTIDADKWLPPSFIAGAMARGLRRDLSRWLSRRG